MPLQNLHGLRAHIERGWILGECGSGKNIDVTGQICEHTRERDQIFIKTAERSIHAERLKRLQSGRYRNLRAAGAESADIEQTRERVAEGVYITNGEGL